MAYQETTTTSYGQRLSNSFKGIATGFIMIIVGTVLLWWNEGRAVKTTKALKEAEKVSVHVDDVSQLNPELEGQLIHATAKALTEDYLSDPTFGVGEVAIKVSRKVEYYQWKENKSEQTRDKVGGGQETITTYTYSKDWVSSPIQSGSFKEAGHDNFTLMTIEDQTQVAQNVSFGAYRLPSYLINRISDSKPLDVNADPELLKKMDQDLCKMMNVVPAQTADQTQEMTYLHVDKNVIYLGTNPRVPAIGDVKITFTKVLPGEVSIISKVYGDTFQEYTAKNGNKVSSLAMGAVGMEEMYATEHANNAMLTWLLRVVGILLVIRGLKNIFEIIVTLLKVLPFLASIANLGVGLVCSVLGFVWSLIIILLAWLFYRPLLAIGLLVVVVALVWFLVKKGKEAEAAKAATPAPAPAPAPAPIEEAVKEDTTEKVE